MSACGPRLTRLSRSSSDKEPASYTTQHTERNSQHARETGRQSENEHAGLDVNKGTEEVSGVLTRTLGLPALGPFLVRWDRRCTFGRTGALGAPGLGFGPPVLLPLPVVLPLYGFNPSDKHDVLHTPDTKYLKPTKATAYFSISFL